MTSTLSGIPSSGVGSLSTLLKRLEAATARLEDIAVAQAPGPHLPSGASALHGLSAPSLSVLSVPSNERGGGEIKSESVLGFEAVMEGGLKRYGDFSKEIGGVIFEQAQAVMNAFSAQRDFIEFSSKCYKLDSNHAEFTHALSFTSNQLVIVGEIKDRNRGSPFINQLSVVAEGIASLGWITLDSKPGPFISDMKESAQFYANRVVKENKESDPKQVEWVRAFILLLEDLRKYVMEFHTTGLSWNPKGIDPLTYKKTQPSSTSLSPTTSISNVLPPVNTPTSKLARNVPRISSPLGPAPTAMAGAPAAGIGGVFAALNQGEGVTAGLKKVEKSEMVHKNPELRGSGVVGVAGRKPAVPLKPSSMGEKKKVAVMELQGNKWVVENQENDSTILIEKTEINQIINIFNVKSSTIQIKGKVNAISIVNCKKLSVLLDSTVSSLSISTSPSITIQILGTVPTILIDGTDSGQIYLSKASLGVEIITSKSSAINISLPMEGEGEEEEGRFVEKGLPEMFLTKVVGGKLVTEIFAHTG